METVIPRREARPPVRILAFSQNNRTPFSDSLVGNRLQFQVFTQTHCDFVVFLEQKY